MQTPDSVSKTTLAWYEQLGPWASADDTNLLLTFIDSIGSQYDETEQYTRDDPTHTGWGQLLDVNVCPDAALPWLAQFAGVVVPVGMASADIRNLIKSQPNTKRGTLDAVRSAATALLTGSQRVDITERSPDPYSFEVVTYAEDTPDPTAVLAALTAAKPAGLKMTYVMQSGPTWSQMAADTWAGMGVTTWADEGNLTPP